MSHGRQPKARRLLGPCDWVVILDGVANIAPHKRDPGAERRLIIRENDGLNVILFIRTTEPWTGPLIVEHLSHSGTCSHPCSCRIDVDGRVNLGQLKILLAREVADAEFSCHEPDDSNLAEKVMASPPRPKVKTRKGRR